MFLKVSTEERGIGEFQVVGNLLNRHVGKAQPMLDGLQREKLYHVTGATVHRLLQQHREILGSDVQLTGEIIHLADPTATLLHQSNRMVLKSDLTMSI